MATLKKGRDSGPEMDDDTIAFAIYSGAELLREGFEQVRGDDIEELPRLQHEVADALSEGGSGTVYKSAEEGIVVQRFPLARVRERGDPLLTAITRRWGFGYDHNLVTAGYLPPKGFHFTREGISGAELQVFYERAMGNMRALLEMARLEAPDHVGPIVRATFPEILRRFTSVNEAGYSLGDAASLSNILFTDDGHIRIGDGESFYPEAELMERLGERELLAIGQSHCAFRPENAPEAVLRQRAASQGYDLDIQQAGVVLAQVAYDLHRNLEASGERSPENLDVYCDTLLDERAVFLRGPPEVDNVGAPELYDIVRNAMTGEYSTMLAYANDVTQVLGM